MVFSSEVTETPKFKMARKKQYTNFAYAPDV